MEEQRQTLKEDQEGKKAFEEFEKLMDEANSLSEQQRLVVTAVEEGNPPDLCFEDHYELINSRGIDLPITSD